MEVKEATGVREAVEGVGDAAFLVGLRPQSVAIWGSKVVTIQSASGGRGAFRYAELLDDGKLQE